MKTLDEDNDIEGSDVAAKVGESIFVAPPVALVDGRTLVVADRILAKDSFDELLLPVLYAQLRANYEIKKHTGSGSNPEAPEARDPMAWFSYFREALEICRLTQKDMLNPDGYSLVDPNSDALTYVHRMLLFGAAEADLGWSLTHALREIGWSSAKTFFGNSLDGGEIDKPKTIRCRMACYLSPGPEGRQLAFVFLAIRYPNAPAPDLDKTFAKEVEIWVPRYRYIVIESVFPKIKEDLIKKLTKTGRLSLIAPVSIRA